MNTQQPAAAWSGFLKGTSIAVAVLLIGASVLVALIVPAGHARLAMAIPLAILLGSALFVVRGYTIRDGELLVDRLLWTTHVTLGPLREATIDPDAGNGSIRLMGNGGLFAFCGWFRNATLGRYRAFVTDWQRAVVLHAGEATVVLSPADPAGFVAALKLALAPVPARRAAPDRRRL